MDIVLLDDHGRLYLSPRIDDWKPLHDHGISVIFDLDGDLDSGIPTTPNEVLYIYFPIYDEDLPDLQKLHALAKLGAELVGHGQKVLSHCGMGFNRSALLAGLILIYLGFTGQEAVNLLRSRRPGALFNSVFCDYLLAIDGSGEAIGRG
ncbi:MAG TPA: dual specificity protein phosphatase family protein [Thermoanaerobaculia bacterium]|nr:dual specificity protein phosphatase family protein [Thermoanaerobaculia bacterium]